MSRQHWDENGVQEEMTEEEAALRQEYPHADYYPQPLDSGELPEGLHYDNGVWLSTDWGQASAPISALHGPEPEYEWRNTGRQVADFRHSPEAAAEDLCSDD